jgi:hypothetical protein
MSIRLIFHEKLPVDIFIFAKIAPKQTGTQPVGFILTLERRSLIGQSFRRLEKRRCIRGKQLCGKMFRGMPVRAAHIPFDFVISLYMTRRCIVETA